MRSWFYRCTFPLLAVLLLSFSACGDAGTENTSDNDKSADLTKDSFDDLPNCTANREGMKAYVEDEEFTYVCANGVWTGKKNSVDSYANEDELPRCTAKREGRSAYIEDKGSSYICTDGEWVDENEIIDSDDSQSKESEDETESDDNDSTLSSSSSEFSSSAESSASEGSSDSEKSSSSKESSSSSAPKNGKLFVDLGSTVYSAETSGSPVVVELEGMPSTSDYNYLAVYFEPNMSGGYARNLAVIVGTNNIYYMRQHMYASNKASVITTGDKNFTFTAVENLDTKTIDGGLNYYWSGWSTGKGHIKLVYDRSELTFYLYVEDTYIGYGTVSIDPIGIDKIKLGREQPMGENTCQVSNVRVAGFSSLATAKAWDGTSF